MKPKLRQIQKLRSFKIACAKKWRCYLLLLPISIVCSCASIHKKEIETPWNGTDRLELSPRNCRAKVSMDLTSKFEHHHGPAEISFQWNTNRSELLIHFLNPFHGKAAALRLGPKEATWLDANGKSNLSRHPLFKKWMRPRWWQEIGFLFGLVSKTSGPFVFFNSQHQPTLLKTGGREIRCIYAEDSIDYPKECILKDEDLTARLQFSSTECRPSS